MSEKIIKGTARAFSDKRGWWGICVSTPQGDVWISPGIRSDNPCPATKGQIITATVTGAYNTVVQGTLLVENPISSQQAPINKPQQQTGFKPRPNVGQRVGHAINGAFDLLGHTAEAEDIVEAAGFISDKTAEIQVIYAANNPNMSDYDVGATVGHAVRNAAKIINAKGLDRSRLEGITLKILEVINPAVTEYIQNPKIQETTQVKEEEVKVQPETVVVPEEAQEVLETKLQVQEEPKAQPEQKQEIPVIVPEVPALKVQAVPVEELDDDVPW